MAAGWVRIRGTEDRFDVGRGDAGAPQGGLAPIVRLVCRRYTPRWVTTAPCSGRRGKRTAATFCPGRGPSPPGAARGIGGAVRAHQSHRFEVLTRQFAQGAAFARPTPGGALGTPKRHVRDDRVDGGGAQRRAMPGCSGSMSFPMAHGPACPTPTGRGGAPPGS